MIVMDDVSIVAFAKRAEAYRLLRYMMFENPIDAEQLAVNVDIPELRKVNWAGSGAIGFSNPNGNTYIVYNRGTKYTTTVRPSHISDDQIVYVSHLAASTTLWLRLQESCRILEELSSDVYATFGMKKILDSVAYFYSPRSTPKERPLARYREALANLGEPSTLASNDAIRSWVSKCWSVIELYGSCLLAGDEVKYVLTTLALFELSPFPLTSLFEMNLEWLQQNFGITLGDKPVGMAFPDVNVRFYLEHPIVRPDLAVVWGTGTARVLQKHAEQFRDEAKLKFSIEQFHFNLYLALLYYRCALDAYNVVLSLSKVNLVTGERALQRIEEARTEVALCEEHRVVIMASLSAVVLGQLALPNIASVEEFQNWVAGWANHSSLKAELKIRQAYDAELLMPKFLRDLALGLVAYISGETKAGLAKMLSIMQELEKHINEAVLLGDPNYLSTTYGLMAGICAKNGMESERAEYSRRAEASYYKKLVNLK